MSRVLALAAIASCASGEQLANKHVRTSSVAYDIPENWDRVDSKMRGVETSVWTPTENPQRMSVTVIRTERASLPSGTPEETLAGLLLQAQAGLSNARVTPSGAVSTPTGLKGARVELDFTPAQTNVPYHRSHVVLADGQALVHVMFTARSADTFGAFNTVLSTIRHEEGL